MATQTTDSQEPEAPPDQPAAHGQAKAQVRTEDDSTQPQAQINLESSWSQVWQLPVLLLGLGLLGLGVWLALPRSEPPDLNQALSDAKAYLKADNLEQAEQSLELVRAHKDLASADQLGRMVATFGDLNHLQLHKLDPERVQPSVAKNTNTRIVRWYRKAEDEFSHTLDPRQLDRLGRALVYLGREEAALALVERFDPKKPTRRYRLIRRLIEHRLGQLAQAQSEADPSSLVPLLDRFEAEVRGQTDEAKQRRQRIWAAGLRAKLRLESAAPKEARDLLNRRLLRLFRPDHRADLAPLYVMLGQAYQKLEKDDAALQQYAVAQAMVESSNPLNAHILVGQGRIRLSRGGLGGATGQANLQQALGLFKTAVHKFPDTWGQSPEPSDQQDLAKTLFGSAYLSALIGQADAEARLGQYQQAAKHFSQAVDQLNQRHSSHPEARRHLRKAMLTHASKAQADGAAHRALNFLQRLKPLYDKQLPVALLQRLAQAHEALGREHLANAAQANPGPLHSLFQPPTTPADTQGGAPRSADASGSNTPTQTRLDGALSTVDQPGGAANGPSPATSGSPPAPAQAGSNASAVLTPAMPGGATPPNAKGSQPKPSPTQGQTKASTDSSWYSPSDQARRLHNQQAAVHFGKAANLYRRLAEEVTITKDQLHGQALWNAARDYERSQNWDQAIETYDRFVETRVEDPRLIQAKHRLAKAYLAHGQAGPAIDLFNELLKGHPKAKWTNESLVPLARAYLLADQPAKARATLVRATNDHPAITPDSTIYRDALIQLGKLYYRQGRKEPQFYIDAIEILSEAVSRYGQTHLGPTLRYLLADSNRLSIEKLDEKLDRRGAQRQRIALQSERVRRLEEAQMYYNQALTELDNRPSDKLSSVERTYLRNAYFYQADCAFDLGRYEQSIALYKTAASRWEEDPASLVAHAQIFNAYCELGQYKAAKVANDRALWALNRIPEKTFKNDPTLPMSREHWKDWLRWNSELQLVNTESQTQASAGTSGSE